MSDRNWFDALSEILSKPLPGTEKSDSPNDKPVVFTDDDDDDSLLDKITDILSKPLPGTAPAAPTGTATAQTQPDASAAPENPGESAVRDAESPDADPVSRLDVQMLQERVLAPMLGVDDPRTSDRISFAGGIRGTDYLKQQVDEGKGVVAFSMFPVTVEQLMAISDANQIMAPKSTWFEPKLRSGLFIHTF